MQVLSVDRPGAHGQWLPHRAEGTLSWGQADLGPATAGSDPGMFIITTLIWIVAILNSVNLLTRNKYFYNKIKQKFEKQVPIVYKYMFLS